MCGITTGAKGDNFGKGAVPIFAKTASHKSDRRTANGTPVKGERQ